MKKVLIIFITILSILIYTTGCSSKEKIYNYNSENNSSEDLASESVEDTTSEAKVGINNETDTEIKNESNDKLSREEKQRIDLYVSVMKAAFEEENGGNDFVAVKLDTLDNLSNQAKKEVLNKLKVLSLNVYNYEHIKDDSTKFEFDNEGRLKRTLNGALLWIEVKEYSENKAIITGVSWFGNLGAVFPEYETIYKDGEWQLKLISMAVS